MAQTKANSVVFQRGMWKLRFSVPGTLETFQKCLAIIFFFLKKGNQFLRIELQEKSNLHEPGTEERN